MIVRHGLQKVNSRSISILCISIVAMIGACQQSERPTQPPIDVQPVDNSQYFLYDTSCQRQSLERVQLTTADDDRGILLLKGDADSLQTSLIAKTIYGETYRRYCHFYDASNGQRCLDNNLDVAPWVKVAGSGKKLRLCPIYGHYPEDSFESIAITSSYYLHRAEEFFALSVGGDLPQMNLLILPFFQTVYEQDGVLRDNFLYNNLMYFPASRDLTVLPEPRNYQGASLWESSFVLAHEFAHHMQFAQMNKTPNIALTAFSGGLRALNSELKTPNSELKALDSGLKALNSGPRALGNGLKALNSGLRALGYSPYRRGLEAFLEGWADVFAYYSEGESSANVTRYPCWGDNRDVGRAYFAGGIAKVIDRQILASYTDLYDHRLSACGEADFGDSHTIGAVFAHHMHVIVSHVVDKLVDHHRTIDKYRYLHGWLSKAIADHKKSDNLFADLLASVYVEASVTIAELVVDVERRLELQDEVCRLFEQGFPQLSGCRDA